MSPEPADVQPRWEPPRLLGFLWVQWEGVLLYFAQFVFCAALLAIYVSTVWLLPSTPPGPSVWGLRLAALVGAGCFLSGHAVLAMRAIATDPVGRRQLVRSGIELLLAAAALLLLAALDWLILPTAHFATTKTLPHWLEVVDGLVAADLLLIGVLASLDGGVIAARTIFDEWHRLTPATVPTVSPRPRVLVDQN